jgi:uncharacterized phage-like protein YoqJ
MRKLSVTGHRPKILGWGYDYNSDKWMRLRAYFKQEMKKDLAEDPEGKLTVYSGMALGVDTVFFQAAQELREEGKDVRIVAVIPFEGQESQWPEDSQKMYRDMLAVADETICVCAPGYAGWKLNARNGKLIDLVGSDGRMLAIWNGKKSGTGDCVARANKAGVPVTWMEPWEIERFVPDTTEAREHRKAYETVLNDLLSESGPEMFRGTYDAKNGSEQYMYGICAVIEHIAYHVSDERGDEVTNLFTHNMIESEKKYGVGAYTSDVDDKEDAEEEELEQ